MCTSKKQMPLFMPHPPELSPDAPRAWARDKCNNDVWNGSGWCRQCFRSVGFQAFFQAHFAQPLSEVFKSPARIKTLAHRSSSDHPSPSVSEAHLHSAPSESEAGFSAASVPRGLSSSSCCNLARLTFKSLSSSEWGRNGNNR